MSTTFLGGGECWGKGVATTESVFIDEVDAVTPGGIEENFDNVEEVLRLEILADCDCEILLGALASPGRLSQGFVGIAITLKAAVSQQPAAAAWLPAFSLQQKYCV